MPICKTKAADGRTGIGVTCELEDTLLRKMSAGEVFEKLAAEFWADFLMLSGADPDEDLDRTYNRSFFDKASRIIH
jgi:hypothetical protein